MLEKYQWILEVVLFPKAIVQEFWQILKYQNCLKLLI